MKLKLIAGLALATAAFATAPVTAQRSSYTAGVYWDVSSIDVEDGQFENYMDYLNSDWKKQQEWAKSKGYILGYHILSNGYKRGTEPDLYLVTVYKDVPTAAEEQRRQDEFVATIGRDEHKMDVASGVRTKMRTRLGTMQLQELMLAK